MAAKGSGYAADINLINMNTVVEGKITTQGNIRIDGKLTGNLIADGATVIGSTGDIKGDIQVRSLVSGGKIEGKAIVQERTVLESTSSFLGNLFTRKLIVEEGALFDGNCTMKSEPNAEPTAKEGK